MHPELYLTIYRQRERELTAAAEHRRIAAERATAPSRARAALATRRAHRLVSTVSSNH